MELQAALEGLRNLKHPARSTYTDSQYLKNGMESWLAKWKGTAGVRPGNSR
jgi:ribonuclease HI